MRPVVVERVLEVAVDGLLPVLHFCFLAARDRFLAVGHLLSRSRFFSGMEGRSAGSLLRFMLLGGPLAVDRGIVFLSPRQCFARLIV